MYKYNLLWQLLRIKIKQTSLDNKLEKLLCFYQQYPSKENQDRITNYLKGLYISNKHTNILQCIHHIKSIIPNAQDVDIDINNVCTQDLVKLYKDLYNRNSKWLKNNYRNKDLNNFLYLLYNELHNRNTIVKKNFDIIPVDKSTHKFIF
jgi:hypothetical protein